MKLRLHSGSVTTVALVLLAGALADAEPRRHHHPDNPLIRLMAAGRRVTYAGTQTIELRLGRRQGRGTARMAQLDGCTRMGIFSPERLKGTVILERGSRQMIRPPGQTEWHSRPGNSLQHPYALLRNYTVDDAGSATIAGRAATIVEIRRRDDTSGKPARKLWLDSQTGVVLRAEVSNWRGQTVYTSEFQEIDYTPQLDPKDFQIPRTQHEHAGDGQQSVSPVDPVPTPGYVPAGYQQVGRPRWVRTRHGDAVHLRYSDGLNAISVFIRKRKPGEPGGGADQRRPGLDQPLASFIHRVRGDYSVALIGDIAPTELQRMADSFP